MDHSTQAIRRKAAGRRIGITFGDLTFAGLRILLILLNPKEIEDLGLVLQKTTYGSSPSKTKQKKTGKTVRYDIR